MLRLRSEISPWSLIFRLLEKLLAFSLVRRYDRLAELVWCDHYFHWDIDLRHWYLHLFDFVVSWQFKKLSLLRTVASSEVAHFVLLDDLVVMVATIFRLSQDSLLVALKCEVLPSCAKIIRSTCGRTLLFRAFPCSSCVMPTRHSNFSQFSPISQWGLILRRSRVWQSFALPFLHHSLRKEIAPNLV